MWPPATEADRSAMRLLPRSRCTVLLAVSAKVLRLPVEAKASDGTSTSPLSTSSSVKSAPACAYRKRSVAVPPGEATVQLTKALEAAVRSTTPAPETPSASCSTHAGSARLAEKCVHPATARHAA